MTRRITPTEYLDAPVAKYRMYDYYKNEPRTFLLPTDAESTIGDGPLLAVVKFERGRHGNHRVFNAIRMFPANLDKLGWIVANGPVKARHENCVKEMDRHYQEHEARLPDRVRRYYGGAKAIEVIAARELCAVYINNLFGELPVYDPALDCLSFTEPSQRLLDAIREVIAVDWKGLMHPVPPVRFEQLSKLYVNQVGRVRKLSAESVLNPTKWTSLETLLEACDRRTEIKDDQLDAAAKLIQDIYFPMIKARERVMTEQVLSAIAYACEIGGFLCVGINNDSNVFEATRRVTLPCYLQRHFSTKELSQLRTEQWFISERPIQREELVDRQIPVGLQQAKTMASYCRIAEMHTPRLFGPYFSRPMIRQWEEGLRKQNRQVAEAYATAGRPSADDGPDAAAEYVLA